MLRKLTELKKRTEGFTIIEVLIVLAIAALILVIVLVAIPQLQRNQRNTARKATINRMSTEIGSYSGNNTGNIPTSAANTISLYQRYYGCAGVGFFLGYTYTDNTNCSIDIREPNTGENYRMLNPGVSDAAGVNNTVSGLVGTVNHYKVVVYKNGYKCSGESAIAGGARDFVMLINLEGGAVYCRSNG